MPRLPAHALKRLRELLHDQYNEVVAEPLPDRWVEVINHLNQQERDAKASKRAT
jgi:hypothetical protein